MPSDLPLTSGAQHTQLANPGTDEPPIGHGHTALAPNLLLRLVLAHDLSHLVHSQIGHSCQKVPNGFVAVGGHQNLGIRLGEENTGNDLSRGEGLACTCGIGGIGLGA